MQKPGEVAYLTLDNLGLGAARELFQNELDKVLENILDPNTPATAKRSVALSVTIVPNEDRSECGIQIEATSKIAPYKGAGGVIFVGRKDGRAVATSYDARQMTLGFDAAGPVALPRVEAAPEAAAQ